MSIINKPILKNEKSPTQQSDIIIESNGKIHISFLWDDLKDVPGLINGIQDETPLTSLPAISWISPSVANDLDFLNEFRSCQLCPKHCGFNRMERVHPTCGDYQLRIGTFGISFGDEPEVKGSRGSGAIMLSGCPLKCPSCHNPEKVADGVIISVYDFIKICEELLQKGAHNIQILSPTVHFPTLRVALKILKDSAFPIPILLKSSGYETIDQIKQLAGLIDIYLPDFKFGSCSKWSKKAGVKNYFEKAEVAILEMIRQVGPIQFDANGVIMRGVLVRHVESPLPPEEREQIRSFLNNLPPGVLVSSLNNFVLLE